jgi:hypothetical protein
LSALGSVTKAKSSSVSFSSSLRTRNRFDTGATFHSDYSDHTGRRSTFEFYYEDTCQGVSLSRAEELIDETLKIRV